MSPQLLFVDDDNVKIVPCLYSSQEFCNALLDCIKLNSKFCESDAARHANVIDSMVSHHTNRVSVAAIATAVATATTTTTATTTFTPSSTIVTSNGIDTDDANVNVNVIRKLKPQTPSLAKITPPVSINVTDSENLNVCMCSLFASSDNVLAEQQEKMIGAICPRCQNIIKQQPIERKTLISKRMTLSNDIIVNRVDTHLLSLKTALAHGKRYEPYTPDSIESHSPFAEPDILEFPQNDERDMDVASAAGVMTNDEITGGDLFDANNSKRHNVHARTASLHSTGVSPLQLKSRLEHLRKTSTDASGMVNSCHLVETRKDRSKSRFCFDKCCVIL